MSAEEVAQAFVQHYFQTFDSNVDNLAGLFVSLLLGTHRCCCYYYGPFLPVCCQECRYRRSFRCDILRSADCGGKITVASKFGVGKEKCGAYAGNEYRSLCVWCACACVSPLPTSDICNDR